MTAILQNKEQLQGASTIAKRRNRVGSSGKRGLTEILRSMGSLDPEERKVVGQAANQTRSEIEAMLAGKYAAVKEAEKQQKFKAERIDVTEPGKQRPLGTRHLITITIDEITRIFMSMGYSIAEGPEIETVYFNFDALNAATNHPSRDNGHLYR